MILVSCEKTSTIDQTNLNSGFNVTERTSLISPANPLNQYDYVGQTHNRELMHFIDSILPKPPIEDTIIYNRFYVQGMPSYVELVELLSQREYDPTNYTPLMAQLYRENSVLFPYLNNVNSIVNGNYTLQQKIDALKYYENSINYSIFTANQTMALKAAISVARYSSVLWASQGEGGLGYNDIKIESRDINPIVSEDIWGTLAGAWFTANPLTAIAGGIVSSGVYWYRNRVD